MPWLIKDQEDSAENLFFVHVPRCGGTRVPQKSMQGRSMWGKLGMTVFFSRYKTLESTNFPVLTWGNAISLVLFSFSWYLIAIETLYWTAVLLNITSVALIVLLTVIFTAPVIGRVPFIHRCYLLFVHYVLCRFMESVPWCTGTNKTGYIMHLTAHKLLAYNYVTPKELDKACSMAIVRSPYSRMVSIYSYNRFGEWESFEHFVIDWYNNVTRAYRERGEMEEWYTPCHAIPQFEYTHFEGKQLVRSIVKQEELKLLKTVESSTKAVAEGSTVADLPVTVREALLGMPHTNSRKLKKKWYEYYNQKTLDLVYEMYENDFTVFDYDPVLTQRPDLKPPVSSFQKEDLEIMEPSEKMERMRRDSWSVCSEESRTSVMNLAMMYRSPSLKSSRMQTSSSTISTVPTSSTQHDGNEEESPEAHDSTLFPEAL